MNYDIQGGAFPLVICHLDAGESMRTERGSMAFMDPCMQMETTVDGFNGLITKAFGGENIFQNIYTALEPGKIAFRSSFPGSILTLEVDEEHEFVVQKTGFLASQMGVELSLYPVPKPSIGFFGGEGFIMQKLSGSGTAFVEVDGSLVELELAEGQQLVVDTGTLLGFTEGVGLEVQTIKGAKNVLFGGEGLFNTLLTGPGTVWLQTLPVSGYATSISPFLLGTAEKAAEVAIKVR